MEYIKGQKMMTNVGGLLLLILLMVSLILKAYWGAIVVFIGGILAYLYWRKFDEKEELEQKLMRRK